MGKKAIKMANKFCEAMASEKRLRDAIAQITAKLNRCDLSARQGKRNAKRLMKAYRRLKPLE